MLVTGTLGWVCDGEWKKWLIEFNVSCAGCWPKTIKEIHSTFVSLVKRLKGTSNNDALSGCHWCCGVNLPYVNLKLRKWPQSQFEIVAIWQSLSYFRSKIEEKKEFATSICFGNGAKSCKVNCTISNGFLMIFLLCSAAELWWAYARNLFLLRSGSSPHLGTAAVRRKVPLLIVGIN